MVGERIWVDPEAIGLLQSRHRGAQPPIVVQGNGQVARASQLELLDQDGRIVARLMYSRYGGPGLRTRVWLEVLEGTVRYGRTEDDHSNDPGPPGDTDRP